MARKHKDEEEETINVFDKENVKKWCDILGCEKEDLIHAVLTIGKSPKIVNDFLTLNRKKRN